MPNTKRVFIFGLDGVISQPGTLNMPTEWNDDYNPIELDEPIDAVRNLMRAIHPSWAHVWIMTNRPESLRVPTNKWLMHNGFNFDKLMMRPDTYDGSSYEYKLTALQAQVNSGYQILGVFEDNPSIVRALKEWGRVPVCAIAPAHPCIDSSKPDLHTVG